jgi:hypothetical protein
MTARSRGHQTDRQGLGTSTSADAKKYFTALERHRLGFEAMKPEERALIDMAFNKKKADDRKEWLRQFKVGCGMKRSIDAFSSQEHSWITMSRLCPFPTSSTRN